MPTAYKIEVSPNNRAKCRDQLCRDEGINILKGQLRFGVWLVLPDYEMWSYKHWYAGLQV
jgi:Poly(ADP-ribose) polymerase and DNA-Ligase Zn-finger region